MAVTAVQELVLWLDKTAPLAAKGAPPTFHSYRKIQAPTLPTSREEWAPAKDKRAEPDAGFWWASG